MRTVKQRWKTFALVAMVAAGLACSADAFAAASKKNVMCVKTNDGVYIPVVRVSMMVVPDRASTFDILVKDGRGEYGVESISFEKHEEEIDFDLYKTNSDGTAYVDLTKASWLITSTGKFFKTMDVTQMNAKEGSELFDVVTKNGTEADVKSVFFLRGTEAYVQEYVAAGIDEPLMSPAIEKLQLLTPIREEMSLSGCGNATVAQVFSVDGKLQTEAAVRGGNTTIYVGQLPAGVYVVRVGNKALKFSKK